MIEKEKIIEALEKTHYIQKDTAALLGISQSYLSASMTKYNIKRRFHAEFEISRDLLLTTLKNNNYIKVNTANELKVPLTTIDILINTYNIKIPILDRYNILPIDTRLKAYMLGLFICDSGITEKEIVEIGLADEEIINVLAVEMNANKHRSINTWGAYRYSIRKKVPGIISIYGGRLKTDRKIPFDLIPYNLFNYFVLGMLDGDGSISYNLGPKPYHMIEFDSSGTFLLELVKYIYLTIGVQFNVSTRTGINTDYLRIYIYKREYIIKFLSWVYSDPSFIILHRKFQKAYNLINELNNRQGLLLEVDKDSLPFIYNTKPFTIG